MGAIPFVKMMTNSLERELLLGATEEQQKIMAEVDCRLMEQMDAFIGVRGEDNLTEQYDVPTEKIDIQNRLYDDPVHHQIRVPHTKGWYCATPQMPGSVRQDLFGGFQRISILMYAICYGKMQMPGASGGIDDKTDRVRLVAMGYGYFLLHRIFLPSSVPAAAISPTARFIPHQCGSLSTV